MTARERFEEVFAHYGRLVAYARRRGAPDPEAVAAETLEIAWRRLDRLPADDPLPWLYRTAANVLANQRRAAIRAGLPEAEPRLDAAAPSALDAGLDPELEAALMSLSPADRELLLLVAWEELTPAEVAAALRISRAAARVRLLRARRRFERALSDQRSTHLAKLAIKEES